METDHRMVEPARNALGGHSRAPAPATPREETRTRWDIVALALTAGIVAGLQVGKVPPALPFLEAALGLSRVMAGLVASLFYASGAMVSIPTGLLADRLGPRLLVSLGAGLLAMGSLVGGLAEGAPLLLASRVIEGLGMVMLAVAAPKIIGAASTLRDRGLAIGIWGTYMPVGMALAMVIAPALFGPVGWRGLWLINAAIVALFIVAFVWGTAPARWRAPAWGGTSFDWRGAGQTIARAGPWLFGLCFMLYTIQWFALMAWLPTFLIETQGHSPGAAAWFAALVVFVNTFGNLTAAWLMYRRAARWLLIAVAYIAMGTCAVFIFAPFGADAAKIPLAVTFSLLGGLLPASCLAGAAAHAPSYAQVAMANGFVVQGAALGSLIGPPALAAVAGAFGSWESAWWTMLVCPAIGLAGAAALRVTEARLERPV